MSRPRRRRLSEPKGAESKVEAYLWHAKSPTIQLVKDCSTPEFPDPKAEACYLRLIRGLRYLFFVWPMERIGTSRTLRPGHVQINGAGVGTQRKVARHELTQRLPFLVPGHRGPFVFPTAIVSNGIVPCLNPTSSHAQRMMCVQCDARI